MASSYNLIDDRVIENCIREIRESKGMSVRISPAKRSRRQNDLIHPLVRFIAKDTGHTEKALKTHLKIEWMGFEDFEHKGRIERILKSTEDYTKEEASEFIDKLYALGASLNIKLPTPSYYGY